MVFPNSLLKKLNEEQKKQNNINHERYATNVIDTTNYGSED